MTHAGELTVAAARNGLRLAEMEEVLALWEEIGRIAADRHGALGIVQGSAAAGLPAMRAAADRLNVLQSREEETLARLGAIMRRLARGLSDDATKLDFLSYELAEGIRDIRMLPLSAVFNLFPRMVRDLAGAQGKEVELTIEGGDTGVDKRILEQIKDPLMHMIRNAIDHGIEPPAERMRAGKSRAGMLLLRAYRTAANTVIEVVDDGRGLDLDAIRHTAIERGIAGEADLARMSDAQLHALIFNPGFSTRSEITDISGRGVGMEVVRENIERLKGTVHIDASPGNGCFVRIHLPLTLATARMLILGVDDQSYAVPVESVRSTILVTPDEIRPVEGRETVVFDGRPVSIAPLAELLELAAAGDRETDEGRAPQALPCVIIDEEGEVFGVMVDTLIDEQEVVLKADSPLLRGVRNVAGSTILGSGRVCVILNPHDLLASMRRRRLAAPPARELEAPRRARAVLLVEDSITTRTQVKRILEAAGFEVVAAVDGVDGLSKLGTRAFDAVISDIQMPNLDGLGLTARIRQEKRYADLPVILMTSLASEEDRRRGIEVGASAYLTKPTFDQNVLLDTLRRLI
jgi:two-component system chemotaxis sensor kinase CheA